MTPRRSRQERTTPRRLRTGALAAAVLTVSGAITVSSCGGDGSPNTTAELTPIARLGLEAAQHAGCGSCHGSDFGGGAGPPLTGLYGSERQLADGSTVTADRTYLVESIADPAAKKVAGYSLAMPRNSLTTEQIDRIVTFITELADAPG